MPSVRSRGRRYSANLNSGRSIRIPAKGCGSVQLEAKEAESEELLGLLNAGHIIIEQDAAAPAPPVEDARPAAEESPRRSSSRKES